LRAIKEKYDPAGLFVVHHGVGSEEWSSDGFTPGFTPFPSPSRLPLLTFSFWMSENYF
jgi:hypothetical protein